MANDTDSNTPSEYSKKVPSVNHEETETFVANLLLPDDVIVDMAKEPPTFWRLEEYSCQQQTLDNLCGFPLKMSHSDTGFALVAASSLSSD